MLPEKGFYSSWRAGRAGFVERTVLRLLSAARRKVGRDATAVTPYQVGMLCVAIEHLSVVTTWDRSAARGFADVPTAAAGV